MPAIHKIVMPTTNHIPTAIEQFYTLTEILQEFKDRRKLYKDSIFINILQKEIVFHYFVWI